MKVYFMQQFSMKASAIIIHIFVCFANLVLLFILDKHNHLKREKEVMASFIVKQREQFDISKVMTEAVNRKYHDMKFQLSALRDSGVNRNLLDKAEKELENLEIIVDVGNDALNVVLSEKYILCKKADIKFTYVVDGKLIDFMEIIDLYAMLGNIVGNAIEYLKQVGDKDKRIVILNISRVECVCVIRLDNYFENDNSLVLKNGLPCTTKEDKFNHGYGLKNVQLIAKKYKGNMQIITEENIFSVRIVIPLPDEKQG